MPHLAALGRCGQAACPPPPACSLWSVVPFSHLHTRSVWQPCCVTEVCRSRHRFLSWRQKRGEITMFTETVGNSHAGHRVARRHYLLPLLIALAFAFYPNKAQAPLAGDLVVNVPFQFHAGNAK